MTLSSWLAISMAWIAPKILQPQQRAFSCCRGQLKPTISTWKSPVCTAAGLLGALKKADIKAEAKVESIENAFVNNSATAIANNASFTIESGGKKDKYGDDNHVLIADLVQWSYADVTAKAEAKDVDIEGYNNFKDACFTNTCDGEDGTTPIVTNVATAIGNNLNIKVGVPEPKVQ